MAGLLFESEWDFGRIPASIGVDGARYNYTSGVYTHSDWSGEISDAEWTATEFGPGLALLLQVFEDPSFTVTWSAANLTYTIAQNNNFALDFIDGGKGKVMRKILGFASTYYSGSNSYTSDAEPWFAKRAPYSCRNAYNPDHEATDGFFGGNYGGVVYGRAPAVTRKLYDFKIEDVPREDVLRGLETNQSPWSWESFWLHHRTGMKFVCDTRTPDGVATAHAFTKEGCRWQHSKVAGGKGDYIGAYDLDFKTWVYR